LIFLVSRHFCRLVYMTLNKEKKRDNKKVNNKKVVVRDG
jgi:hypothetical protein